MKKRTWLPVSGLSALALLLIAPGASAVPVLLSSSSQCSLGAESNGIAISNVTGNNGGATDCYGTFNGNDPGLSGDGFDIGGTIYNFIAKQDTPGGLSGANIGLSVSPSGGALSGTWAFDPNLFAPGSFLILLKAANSPGHAVWLFDGGDAASFNGTWSVAWNRALSHLSIYAADSVQVPEPMTLLLVGAGLVAVGASRRKKHR